MRKQCPKTGKFVFQAGQYIDSKGYWCYSAGEHRGKRVHRVMAEQELGRPLRKDEHVHHINGDKLDNRPENRKVMGEREHNAVSAKQYWYLKTNVWPKEKAEWDAYFAESGGGRQRRCVLALHPLNSVLNASLALTFHAGY